MDRKSFEFVAGCISLDFVDTVASREGTPIDLLEKPTRLLEWISQSGLIVDGLLDLSPQQLARAKRLREAIYRCAAACAQNGTAETNDVLIINTEAAKPDLRPQLAEGGAIHHHAKDPLNAVLATIAGDAVLTLASDAAARIKRCPECRMLFRDNTRRQNRRWCSSATGCGNRAKVRRHRAAKEKG